MTIEELKRITASHIEYDIHLEESPESFDGMDGFTSWDTLIDGEIYLARAQELVTDEQVQQWFNRRCNAQRALRVYLKEGK